MTAEAKIRMALQGQPAVVAGLKEVERQFDSVKGAVAGLAAGATLAGLTSMIKGAIDQLDRMDEISERTGLAVKDIAGLQVAFDMAGVGSDKLESSMGRLSKQMAAGNEVFDAMGVKVKNADGTLRDTREVLGEVADKFKSYEDGAAKAALAQELFGKSGTEMVSLLAMGSDGLAEMDATAARLGLTISEQTAKDAAQFNDTLDLLGMGVQGVSRQVAAQLLPTLSTLAGEMLTTATNSGSLDTASAALANTLKGAYTVAASGVQIFSNLGRFAGAAGAAVMAVVRGDFAAAKTIMSEVQTDNAAAWQANVESIKRVWADGGNAGVQAMTTVTQAAKTAAPIMAKPGKEASKSMKEARDDAMKLFKSLRAKDAGLDPKYHEQLNQLYGLYKAGRITVEEYRDAVGTLIKQQKFAKDAAEAEKEAYEALLETQKELADAYVEASKAREAGSRSVSDYIQSVHEAAEQLQFEATTQGLTNEARAVAIAQHRVMLDLRKKLAEVNANPGGDQEWRDLEAARLTQAAELDKLNVAQRAVFDEARKNAEGINTSLTDAILRGFESGKGFAKNFRDTLKNMFQTLVLRPVINFIVQPIGNMISSFVNNLLGGILGTGQSGGGILGSLLGGGNSSALSGISSLLSAFQSNGMSGVLGQVGSWFGLGSYGATSAASTAMASGSFANAAVGSSSLIGGGGGSALGGVAAGAAVLAIPMIVGALVERNSRDRTGGAAYATSDWRNDAGTAAGSGTRYDTATNQLPAYQDMVNRMIELGRGDKAWLDKFQGNARALYAALQLAESEAVSMNDHRVHVNPEDLVEAYGDFYRGQGYADPESMGWWNWKGPDYVDVDPEVVAASRQLSVSIADTLTATAQALGQDADFRVTTGWANRGRGALWGAASIEQGGQQIAGLERGDFENTQEYMRAVFSTTMDAFNTFDLPAWATTLVADTQAQIDGLTGDKVGEEAAALYQQASASITQTLTAIKAMIDVFPDFAGASQDAVYNIAQALGGLENLNTAYSSYVQNFYTAQEQADLARAQVQAQFEAAGLAMPATRDAFRAMVESLDLTTEEGQRAFATLMQLSGGFAQITADGNTLLNAAFEGADELANVIREGLLGNLSAQQVGEQMADVVMGGIYNAIAGGFANQITQIMMDGVVTPMLQAAVAGTSMTEAVSQAAIDKMIADATAAAQALGQLLNSEGFQQAMAGIQGAMQSLAPQITAPTPYYTPYSVRREQSTALEQQRAQAAQQAADEAARRAQEIANERLGLEKQLLTLEGNTAALRAIELAQLDPSNRALQERIWALQDEAEAEAQRTAQLKEAQSFLSGFSRTVEEFIFNTRMADRVGVDSQQLAAAKFTAQMTLARAGDRESLGSITTYASALIDSIRRESGTGAEAQLKIGRVLGQLAELPTMLSAEELIVQAVEDMKNTLSGVLVSKFDQLDTNVDGLLTAGELQASGLASNTQIAALMARVDANGDGFITKAEAIRAQAELTKLNVATVNTSVGANTSATETWGSSTLGGLTSVRGRVGDVDLSTLAGNETLGHVRNSTTYLAGVNASTAQTVVYTEATKSLLSTVIAGTAAFKVTSRNTGQGDWSMFAHGGVFTNSVVRRPTPFHMGLMGEAGPEAIMPLVRAPSGHLGVRAMGGAGDSDALAALLAAVLAELRAQRQDDRARHTAIVSPLINMDRRGERWEVIGQPRERKEGVVA